MKNKTMNNFICNECGTKYRSPELIPPPGIKWSDGHVCIPVLDWVVTKIDDITVQIKPLPKTKYDE